MCLLVSKNLVMYQTVHSATTLRQMSMPAWAPVLPW
jgi:hypothetical protein